MGGRGTSRFLRPIGPRRGALCLVLLLSGCPSPEAEFDAYRERWGKLHPGAGSTSGGPSECTVPKAGEMDGDFFMTLTVQQSPTTPAPFLAKLTTQDAGGSLEFSLDIQPLDADDRTTPVGQPIRVGPFPVGPDGKFDADFGTIVIPGESNPAGAFALTADATFHGFLCAGDNFCGDVTGQLTDPVNFPLDGTTTFYCERVTMPGVYPEPPKINCAGALAGPKKG